MQIRRGLAAAWASANPTLEPGELGFVTDAGTTAFKIGDGATVWNSLPYVNSTYPELPVDASFNLNLALAQGRYPLSSANTYTSSPAIPAAEYVQGATDGNSVLTVTVPSNGIVIQQINTSVTAKQFLRAYNGTTWTSWKRIDTLAAADSLSIASITLTGNLTVGTTSGVLTIPAGVVGTPSLRFSAAANTGIYSSGANNLTITTGGADRVSVGTTTTTVNTDLTATGIISANVAGTGTALSVNTGVAQLKTTVVNGLLQVSASTPANKFTVGSIRSATVGLTEIYLNSSPYLKVAPTTGAAASDLVWTGTNAAGGGTTTIRCDGVPTNATDLTTKSYVDTNFAALSAIMPKPQTAAGVGQIVSLQDIYTGGGGSATVTVGAALQTWAYVGFFRPDAGNTSYPKVGVVTTATNVTGPGSTNGCLWVAAIRLV